MNQLLEYITLYRIVWIGGRLGFGKTALAFWLARYLLETGLCDGIISNCPNILPVHIDKDDGTLYNRVVVYDEAWNDLDARTSMTNNRAYGAYARKTGTYWVFPSVHPIDRRLRSVEIKPSHTNILTGATIWNYKIADDEKNPTTGKFSFKPKEAYGLYSTGYIPINDCGIHNRFAHTYFLETGVHYDERDKQDEGRQSQELVLQEAAMAE